MSSSCQDWPPATLTLRTHPISAVPRITWDRTPPSIHIDATLIDDLAAATALADRYLISEPCPHNPQLRHAYLAPQDAPRGMHTPR